MFLLSIIWNEYSLRIDINTELMIVKGSKDLIQGSSFPSFKFTRCIQDLYVAVCICMLPFETEGRRCLKRSCDFKFLFIFMY